MTVKLARQGVDIGIVVRNAQECVKFYRDFIGLELEAEVELPGARMHRFKVGNSIVKLVSTESAPGPANPPGGFQGGTGLRYWTIPANNIDELHDRCQKSSHQVPVALNEARPGVRMFIVEDPDGNWLEFVEYQ